MKHLPDLWDVFAYLSRSHAELGNLEKANYYLEFVEDNDAIDTIEAILN